jgi:ABC-type Fe3+-hydroxamate transport system substrate-binding protein
MIKTFTDQLGNTLRISFPPTRVVSLVPSLTELLYDLNLSDEVVGITKYCVHPTHWAKSKSIVGGTKNFDIQKIRDLRPDLIVGNKEENEKRLIEELMSDGALWMSDINSLTDALTMIESLGALTNRDKEALRIIAAIQNSFDALIPVAKGNRSVLYLIWRKPWMGVGSNTFIHNMIERIGLQNCLIAFDRYPALTEEKIMQMNPDYIFLSSEPYPFKEKHRQELQLLCPDAKILLVDGEMFSWYGSRLVKSADYFRTLKLQ